MGYSRRTFLQSMGAGLVGLSGGTAISWAGPGDFGPGAGTAGQGSGTRPWVFWYWLDANVTREGILADLEAMHEVGIEGFYLFNINGASEHTLVEPPQESQTAPWWDLVRLAISRAAELGMQVGMNICDGWGTAGGAWITPEESAQELVWTDNVPDSETNVHRLRQPEGRLGFYRDVAALAFPAPPGWLSTTPKPQVRTSWGTAAPERLADPAQEEIVVNSEEPGWIEYVFPEPFTLRSVTVRNPRVPILPFISVGYNGAANSFQVEVSDDGRHFRPIHQMQAPVLGWQANMTTLSHAVPPTSGRHFRFVYDPDQVETVFGDGRFQVTRHLRLASLELSSRPVVSHTPIKAGRHWGRSPTLDASVLPDDLCVPVESILDVSEFLDDDGRLHWQAPEGDWIVRRIGTTSNGVITSPSGRAGGLECDKFNPAVVTKQFHGWFGEALEQVGPALAGKVLNILHIDSWEGESQNWSPEMTGEFRRRRGYDLTPFLLAMTGVPVESAARTEGFLLDLRRTVAQLLKDNFFATLEALAHDRGVLFSAEQTNASFISDGMQHYRHVDLPAGEFWMGRPGSDKPSDVREAVSASRLYGKQIVWAEAFTGQLDWSETPFSFKRLGDKNFCIGVNRLMLHVWVHQAFPQRKPGVTLYGYGAFFSASQPWWSMAGAWTDYLARCQHWLQQGRAVVDLCYFTGEDIPSRAYLPEALDPALPRGYAYDSINPDALLTLASVRNGRIELPSGASYVALVLPDDLAVSLSVARKLKELVEGGARIYGKRPRLTSSLEGGEDARRRTGEIVEELCKGGKIIPAHNLGTVLVDLGIQPDVEILGDADIAWTHRRTDAEDIYFLSNQDDGAVVTGILLRAERRRLRLYDPVMDRWTVPVVGREGREGGQARITVKFNPGQSLFAIFDDEMWPGRVVGVDGDGPTPRLVQSDGKLWAETSRPGRWRLARADGWQQGIDVKTLPSALEVQGPWRVRFDTLGQPSNRVLDRLESWDLFDEPSIRYHSGTAVYEALVEVPPGEALRWYLRPGVYGGVVSVAVNGHDCGVIWTPGGEVDVTGALREGENRIAITVANSWRNRLLGDRSLPPAQRTTWVHDNQLGVRPFSVLPEDAELVPSGLMGPVRLLPVARRLIDSLASGG